MSRPSAGDAIALPDARLERKGGLDGALPRAPSLIVAYSVAWTVRSAYAAHRARRRRPVRDRDAELSRTSRATRAASHRASQFHSSHHSDLGDGPGRIRQSGKPLLLLQTRALPPVEIARGAVWRIADGINADDRGDYRPGRHAAREFGVRSPLDEAGLTKDDIRELSRRAGLPTWDEPASACLSSRIPYFSEVTAEKLRMIERAEAVLRDLGFRICRVRHHDAIARLELGPDEIARALEPATAETIDRELRAIGYAHVTVDLRGYRLGSLNDALRLREV